MTCLRFVISVMPILKHTVYKLTFHPIHVYVILKQNRNYTLIHTNTYIFIVIKMRLRVKIWNTVPITYTKLHVLQVDNTGRCYLHLFSVSYLYLRDN